jgi:colanic acid biosynthesis glycosyl transferase WcaI
MTDILAIAMRITVWSINYFPELVGIGVYNTDFCAFLAGAGHQVTMVTGFAYYPTWTKLATDRGQVYRSEMIKGDGGGTIQVWRCWLYVPSKLTAVHRIAHEFSFLVTSFLRLLALPSTDLYFVVLPPLFAGLAAWLLSCIKNTPVILHVQDLQPDAAVSLGMLKPGLFVRLLYAAERFAYVKAKRVSSISPEMCQMIISKGIDANKVVLFPNWVIEFAQSQLNGQASFRQSHGIDATVSIVSYAGNLGAKQGLDLIIEAAKVLANRNDVLFVIAGNGGSEAALKQLAKNYLLANVLFLDVLPEAEHTALLRDSAVCLIPQKAGSSSPFLPSKLLKILALSRPVITNADKESALFSAVNQGGFGITTKPGDANSMADAIVSLLSDQDKLERLAQRAETYVAQFERSKVLSNIDTVLRQVATKS